MEFDFVSLADFLEELADRRGEELQVAATFLAERLRASPSHVWLIDDPFASYIKLAGPEESRRLISLLRYVANHGRLEHPIIKYFPRRPNPTWEDLMRTAVYAYKDHESPNPDQLYSIGGFHREEVERIAGKDAAPPPKNERETGRQESQIQMIVDTAKTLGFDPLDIPVGGKTDIKEYCLEHYDQLFTPSGFGHAWKAANRKNRISLHEKERFLRR